jgi:hypothetical protein
MDGRTALIAAAVALFGPMPAAETAEASSRRRSMMDRDETARTPAVVVVMPDHAPATCRVARNIPAPHGADPLQVQPAAHALERRPGTRFVGLSL